MLDIIISDYFNESKRKIMSKQTIEEIKQKLLAKFNQLSDKEKSIFNNEMLLYKHIIESAPNNITILSVSLEYLINNGCSFLNKFNDIYELYVETNGNESIIDFIDILDYLNDNTTIRTIKTDNIRVKKSDSFIANYGLWDNACFIYKNLYIINPRELQFKSFVNQTYETKLLSTDIIDKILQFSLPDLTILKLITQDGIKCILDVDNYYMCYIKKAIIKDGFDKIEQILEFLSSLNCKKVMIDLKDSGYKKEQLYNAIKKYAKKMIIEINYKDKEASNNEVLPYNGFSYVKPAIKYYKKLIKDSCLSPVEKLWFSNDIVRSFEFKSSNYSRNLPGIMYTGDIVCAGYCRLFAEIAKNNSGIKIEQIILKPISSGYNGHMRLLVRLDDNKYNIHGLFIIDPTFDRFNFNDYSHFLIPYGEYKERFKNDIFFEPAVFEQYKKKDRIINLSLNKLFDNGTKIQTINRYFKTKRPTVEQFKMMYTNVRLAEGYDIATIEKEFNEEFEYEKVEKQNSY